MRNLLSAVGITAFLIVITHPTFANACSCAPSIDIWQSVPEDGAENVPTDVVPWIASGGELLLLDAEGQVVPTTLRYSYPLVGCDRHQELVPAGPLEPNTQYTISSGAGDAGVGAPDAGTRTMSFTTGGGPLGGEPPAGPALQAAFFDANEYMNTCIGDRYQGCLKTDYDGLLDVRVLIDGEETTHTLAPVRQARNFLLGYEAGSEACVQVRARDVAGRFSETQQVCIATGGQPAIEYDPNLDVPLYPYCDSMDVSNLYADIESYSAPDASITLPDGDPDVNPTSSDAAVVSVSDAGAVDEADAAASSGGSVQRAVTDDSEGCSVQAASGTQSPPWVSSWLSSQRPYLGCAEGSALGFAGECSDPELSHPQHCWLG
jgi:hypothetical protein